ncbi:MAG: hypothetical protein DRP85_00805 [Candidatus Makaraimicrobium thalassicum]|nr:MAG: hypothetical protein DRP85_00805 [Candidatus Omnitrophota bacterium]
MTKKLIEFTYEGKKYFILNPTQDQLLRIDLEYRRAFAEAVRNGIMTELEAKQIFEKTGVWGDEQEQKVRELQVQIVTAELELEKEEDEKKGKELAFKIMQLRNKLLDLITHKTRLFSSQTAEGYADEARTIQFAVECTVDENNQRIFNSRADFVNHPDTTFTATCYGYALLANAGLKEEDTRPDFAERRWLREHGYLNNEDDLTDKYYKEIVADAIGTEAKEAKKPRKRRRKKKE